MAEQSPAQSDWREFMLRVCAEHGLKLGYGDKGERLCPAGCVSPRAQHIVVVPLKDVLALLREVGLNEAVTAIEEGYRLA